METGIFFLPVVIGNRELLFLADLLLKYNYSCKVYLSKSSSGTKLTLFVLALSATWSVETQREFYTKKTNLI